MSSHATPGRVAFANADAEKISMEEALLRLAERLVAPPGVKGTVRLELHVDGKVTESELNTWKSILQTDLERNHLIVTEDAGATPLPIGIVETPTQIVFSASVRVGEREQIRIVSIPRSQMAARNSPAAAIRINRQLVFQSTNRILDSSSLWNGAEGGMLVLEYRPGGLTALKVAASGAVAQTISLAGANLRASRDPQAELSPKDNGAEVKWPGKTCTFTWDASVDLKCQSMKPPEKFWREKPVLTSPCDGRDWKFTTNGTDWTSAELLELVPAGSLDQGNSAVSSNFPGPILNISGAQNPTSALVVTRNLQTGNYEVYKITLACGN